MQHLNNVLDFSSLLKRAFFVLAFGVLMNILASYGLRFYSVSHRDFDRKSAAVKFGTETLIGTSRASFGQWNCTLWVAKAPVDPKTAKLCTETADQFQLLHPQFEQELLSHPNLVAMFGQVVGFPLPSMSWYAVQDSNTNPMHPRICNAIVLHRAGAGKDLLENWTLPTRVHWFYFLTDSLILGLFAQSLLCLLRLARWRVRFKGGHCPSCNYDLSGLDGRLCPECGLHQTRRVDSHRSIEVAPPSYDPFRD